MLHISMLYHDRRLRPYCPAPNADLSLLQVKAWALRRHQCNPSDLKLDFLETVSFIFLLDHLNCWCSQMPDHPLLLLNRGNNIIDKCVAVYFASFLLLSETAGRAAIQQSVTFKESYQVFENIAFGTKLYLILTVNYVDGRVIII